MFYIDSFIKRNQITVCLDLPSERNKRFTNRNKMQANYN